MDITSILAVKKAAVKEKELDPKLKALLTAIPTLEQKSTKDGDQFLALNLVFEGAELLSPFFGLAYVLRTLPEEQLLAAEKQNLFTEVRTKISSWEGSGAITVSFFPKAKTQEEEESKPNKPNSNRGR